MKISVIIPIYNMDQYLPECLDSIIPQTLKNIEIICIDDCSTDNSLKILKEYAAKESRIKILQMQKNSGPGPVKNVGIQKATGKYLAFMDPDDYYYDEQCLEVLYNNAIANNVDLCGGNIRFLFNDSGELHQTGNLEFETHKLINTYDIQNPYEYQRYIFRKDTIIKCGIKFPAYQRFEDPVFMLKCLVAIDKLFTIDKVIYIYRVNHKIVAWNMGKCTDLLKGISDILTISRDNNFWIGYTKSVDFFLQVRLLLSCRLLFRKTTTEMMINIASDLNMDKLPNEYRLEINKFLRHPVFYFCEPRVARLLRPALYIKGCIFRFLKNTLYKSGRQ